MAWPRAEARHRRRRSLTRVEHAAGPPPDDHVSDDLPPATAGEPAGAPAVPWAGWQAAAIMKILEYDDQGAYDPRDHLNGRRLAGWLREDFPAVRDEFLAMGLLTLLGFIRQLDDPPGQLGAGVLYAAVTDACQCAVLDLTAAARAIPGGA